MSTLQSDNMLTVGDTRYLTKLDSTGAHIDDAEPDCFLTGLESW